MAFVQAPTAVTAAGSGVLSLAFGSNIVAGDLLLVAVHWDAAQTFTSLTDTQGNTWSLLGAEVNDAGTAQRSRVYSAIANASGACTVSLTVSGTAFKYLSIYEYSATTSFDVASQQAGSGTAMATASFTVAQNSSLLFVFGVCSGTGSAAGGYTSRQTVNGDITADKTASAGSQTGTATQSSATAYIIHAVVFNTGAAAAVASVPSRPILWLLKGFSQQPLSPWLGFPQPQTFPAAVGATVTFDVAVAGAAAVTASMSPTRNIVSGVVGAAAVTADLSPTRNLVVPVAGAATVAADLALARNLSVNVVGAGVLADSIVVNRALAVAVAGAGVATVDMARIRSLVVVVDGNAAVAVAVTVSSLKVLAADIAGAAAVAVAMNPLRGMAALVDGAAQITVQDVIKKIFAATVSGGGVVVADLQSGHVVQILIPAGADDLLTLIPASQIGNQLPVPTFETTVAPWAGWNGTPTLFVLSNDRTPIDGTHIGKVTVPAAGATGVFYDTLQTLLPSKTYTFAVYVWNDGPNPLRLQLREMDASGADVAVNVSPNFGVTGSWVLASISAVFGPTGVRSRLVVEQNGVGAIQTFYIDAASLTVSDTDTLTLTPAGADNLLTLTPAGADDTLVLTAAGADDLITLTPGAEDIG